MTNEEWGKRVGVSHSMASRIRSGNRLPSTKVLQRIGEAFAIPLDELVAAHLKGAPEFGKLIRKYERARAAA